MAKRTIVVGDLHLVRDTPKGAVEDAVRLVTEHPGARLVFLGDLFDLSADHPGAPRARALRDAVQTHAGFARALGEHVDGGGELWVVSGNHDAAAGDPDERESLLTGLRLDGERRDRVRTSPWFFRDGGVHLEHGHLFDPDNATAHPLVAGARSLGVHFVEEFIAPTGAFRYLNANDKTPLWLLASAFRWYGLRGPYVVYKYFDTAFRAMAASGATFDARAAEEREIGARRVATYAGHHGVSVELLEALDGIRAIPTMSSSLATFQRLYLDRVGATVAMMSGLLALAAGKRAAGLSLLTAGALAMGASWAAGFDRYGGSVPEMLARGAEDVARATGAKLVVMGHAHREALTESYANTGSFSFPRDAPGRPFLELETTDGAPRAVRRYLRAS
jgi:predicted phosphodiesterase